MPFLDRVSTHSRPKAAGLVVTPKPKISCSFNTQPPEGGWRHAGVGGCAQKSFNTQPPEGGWSGAKISHTSKSGFNTQPPEGGWHRINDLIIYVDLVSTHSRPKAAGRFVMIRIIQHFVSTHSRPKAAGVIALGGLLISEFQHTAARRRLVVLMVQGY